MPKYFKSTLITGTHCKTNRESTTITTNIHCCWV